MAAVPVWIEIKKGGIFIGYPYHVLTDRAFSISVRRGRNDYTQPFQTGTASVSFRNLDGFMDPDNPDSPYRDSLLPGKEIRIAANVTAEFWDDDPNARVVFVGVITDITIEHDVIGDSIVTINAADYLSFLSQQQIAAGAVFVEENTTDRILAVLTRPEIDFPVGRGDLNYIADNSEGQSICAAETLTNEVNALAYCQTVAQTEQGEFYGRKEGGPFLAGRYQILSAPTFTFTDTTGGTRYEQIERLSSSSQLYNQLQANRTNEPSIQREKLPEFPDPQVRRFLDLGEVLLRSDLEVGDLLDYALVRFVNPTTRVASLTTILDNKTTSEQLGALALELTDSVTIKYTPPGMSQLTLPCTIQGIAHDFTVGLGWRVSFDFLPRDTSNYLVLDDATLGKLDENVLAF
jgi:hypothetical protein